MWSVFNWVGVLTLRCAAHKPAVLLTPAVFVTFFYTNPAQPKSAGRATPLFDVNQCARKLRTWCLSGDLWTEGWTTRANTNAGVGLPSQSRSQRSIRAILTRTYLHVSFLLPLCLRCTSVPTEWRLSVVLLSHKSIQWERQRNSYLALHPADSSAPILGCRWWKAQRIMSRNASH